MLYFPLENMENFSNKKIKYFEDNSDIVEIEFEECSNFYEYCGFMICDAPFHFVENGKRSSGNYPHGIIAKVGDEYYWFTSKENCINSFNTKNIISGFTD